MSLYVTELSQSRPNLGTQLCEVTTIPEEVSRSLKRSPSRVQYVTADGEEITARSFIGTCRNVARSLVAQGLSPNAGVAILAATDVRWFATDVGATLARTIPFGIYTTNSPEIVKHMLNDARAEIVFVDDHERFVKVLSVRAECPSVGHVVYWGDVDISQFPDHKDYVLSWDEFLRLGLDVSDKELEKRVEDVKPGDVCKLIYTSGTTGLPKAVMISHGNCTQAVESFRRFLSVGASDRIISYLPCSHVAANMVDIVGPLMIDMCVHIAPPNALRGSLVDAIRKVKPTIFLAVPRVWEKIHEKMVQIGAKRSFISRYIADVAKSIGTAACEAEETGAPMPFGLGIADRFIFSAVKKALGLDETRLFVNASAPLQSATADYFRSLRIRILDLFGASEASGPLTFNVPETYKRGTSGKCFPGVEVKVANPSSNGEGELCFRGPNIFMGYLNKEEESAKAIDEDGFFHTGDAGTVDEDGFVTVTGRIKELLITAAGENVAPLLVEQTVTEAMSAIDRAFAVGDQRKFISCLVIPRMDANGMLIEQAKEVNPEISTAEEARNDDIWKKYLEEGMKRANGNAISNAASVKKWSILTNDFSVEGGELTPTMKVKRKVVVQKYNDIIEAIYQ